MLCQSVMQLQIRIASMRDDPNGIRTRVTAVKGRCPGPLDDRVTRAGQYRNCYSSTQGKSPPKSVFVLFSLRTKFVNECPYARGGASVPGPYFTRVFHDLLTGFTIAQELFDRHLKGIGVANLDCAVFRDQRFGKRCEVLHVWAKHDRFARYDRFHWILSTPRGQALPHKHGARNSVPALEVASCIEKEAIRFRFATVQRFASESDAQRQSLELRSNFAHAFHVTRRNE